jgi:hypothetical protein
MKARLEAALTNAGVNHKIETYQANDAWVFRDTPVYDATGGNGTGRRCSRYSTRSSEIGVATYTLLRKSAINCPS